MADTAYLEIAPARTHTATLGFGCARLGEVNEAAAIRLIEAALDAGIRHIDVARCYGYGRTEKLVGQAIRGHRDTLTIVSKAGLFPPSRYRRVLSKAARLAGKPSNLPMRRSFNPEAIERAALQSLRRLCTDRLDALLLHDCAAADISQGVKDKLLDLKRRGLVIKLGLATTAAEASAVASMHPDLADVIQIPAASLPELAIPQTSQIITHTVAATRNGHYEDLLGAALRANSGGIVLFSSSSVHHVRANAAFVRPTLSETTVG